MKKKISFISSLKLKKKEKDARELKQYFDECIYDYIYDYKYDYKYRYHYNLKWVLPLQEGDLFF